MNKIIEELCEDTTDYMFSINHQRANIACDCAINQQIERNHLPDGAIYPDFLEKEVKKMGLNTKFPLNENAETYYDLLPEDDKEDGDGNGDGNGDGDGNGNGEGNGEGDSDFYDGLWEKNPLDNHESWNDSEGDEDLKRELTKRMIEKGMEKSRGNVPSNISELLDIWSRKAQVSWKKVLKNIASNKKAKKVSTIMKKSRRFPKRPEIRGHKKDRTWDLICILDVSGSMSDNEIIKGLTEIKEVCRITNTNMKIIQVDTEVHEVSEFNPKAFNRSASGGTEILPGVLYIKENKINVDGILVISDMYIENLSYWAKENIPKVPYIFLGTENREPDGMEYMNNTRYFNLVDT